MRAPCRRLVEGRRLRHLVAALRRVDGDLVAEAHALGLKVVPWTVNAPADMARVIDMKVDGLITDYPDRARDVLAAKGIALPSRSSNRSLLHRNHVSVVAAVLGR